MDIRAYKTLSPLSRYPLLKAMNFILLLIRPTGLLTQAFQLCILITFINTLSLIFIVNSCYLLSVCFVKITFSNKIDLIESTCSIIQQ
jgi:hypothetical protein